MEQHKVNGELLAEEFFQSVESPSTEDRTIDLDEYRSGRALELVDVETVKSALRVTVKKPKKGEWFRAHSQPLPKVWVYEEPGGIDEFYLVRGSVAAEYPGKFYEAYLALCINQNGQLFIWPIKCSPGNQEFTEMSLKHVSFARDRWIRREWDRQRRGFKAEAPTGNIPNPQWPEEIDMRELAATAFGDRLIHSIDHECLRFARAVELD